MAESEGNEPSEGAGRVIRDRQTLHYPRWILTKSPGAELPARRIRAPSGIADHHKSRGFERRH